MRHGTFSGIKTGILQVQYSNNYKVGALICILSISEDPKESQGLVSRCAEISDFRNMQQLEISRTSIRGYLERYQCNKSSVMLQAIKRSSFKS